MVPEHFLTDRSPLQSGDAAAALIVTQEGRYLLQLRDDKPGIFYPGHWGCFGGALSPGESAEDTLRRELEEELEFKASNLVSFVGLEFDLTVIGGTKVFRNYYVVTVHEDAIGRFILHEGAGLALFTPLEIFGKSNVTPYDSFAIWLHVARARFGGPGTQE